MDDRIKKLVNDAKNGSEKAFSELYKKYYKTIWYTILNIVKNTDIADDLTSIVFTKAYVKLESYVNYISFEMWLKTIAINLSIDYIRKYKYEKLNNYIDDEDNKIQLNSYSNSPERDLILREELELVSKLIPTLKRKQKELLIAKIEGKEYRDIAEQFKISETAAKTIVYKARKNLRKKLNKV